MPSRSSRRLTCLACAAAFHKGLAKLYNFFDQEFIEPRLVLLGSSASKKHRDDLLDIVLARHAKAKLTRSEVARFLTVRALATCTIVGCMLFLFCKGARCLFFFFF